MSINDRYNHNNYKTMQNLSQMKNSNTYCLG